MDIDFLIHIMYGRILTIVSNNQLLNNKSFQVDVTIDLGKEIVNKYTLKCFKTDKVYNPNINLINRGKKDNQKLQYRRYSI